MIDERLKEERENARREILVDMKFPYFKVRKILGQRNQITGMSMDALLIWRKIAVSHIEFESGNLPEEEYLGEITKVPNYQTYQIEDRRERIKKGIEGFCGKERAEVARGLIGLLRKEDSRVDNESLGMYNSTIAEYNSLPIEEKKNPQVAIEYARRCSTIIKGELKYLDHFLEMFQMGPYTPRRQDFIETLKKRFTSKKINSHNS